MHGLTADVIWVNTKVCSVTSEPIRVIADACRRINAWVRYFLSNFHFLSNDRPSKTMKNVLYFL